MRLIIKDYDDSPTKQEYVRQKNRLQVVPSTSKMTIHSARNRSANPKPRSAHLGARRSTMPDNPVKPAAFYATSVTMPSASRLGFTNARGSVASRMSATDFNTRNSDNMSQYSALPTKQLPAKIHAHE